MAGKVIKPLVIPLRPVKHRHGVWKTKREAPATDFRRHEKHKKPVDAN